jgi:hypothetical protein
VVVDGIKMQEWRNQEEEWEKVKVKDADVE